MSASDRELRDERILVLAPTRRDADLCRAMLAAEGIACEICSDLSQLESEIERGVGAALLTEESLSGGGIEQLVRALERQPAWSDLPILLLTQAGASSELARQTMNRLGNVTLLERPVRVPTLVSAVQTALRARRRQYQIRVHLDEKHRVAEDLQIEAQRKDEFLAMLAHELRNPLAPILNALELLSAPQTDDQTAAWATGLMKRQVYHVARLVDDLMDIARIMRGKIRLRLEPVEVNSAIHHAVEEAMPTLESLGQKFVLDVVEESTWVMADPNRLSQIIANLLTNAAKYTDRGGEISLSAARGEDEVVIAVRDSGIGIAPAMLARIFEPFTQVNESLDRSRGGLGIGLALVKNLVSMLGGAVEAHSAGLGQGSTFVVRLPIIEPRVQRDDEEWSPASVTVRRVLVVDDNQGAATTLAKLLTEFWGHRVAVAHDGLAALELAREFQPEVALLDLGLPGISGYALAQRLRELPEFETTLLVALTGYGQEEDRRRSMEAGFDEHFVKPASVVALERLFLHPKLRPSETSRVT
jgi:signal transduction histidine kinase/ActR/RegA family two-component response regulator